jgi:uncharacterized protein (TIGR02147 family)
MDLYSFESYRAVLRHWMDHVAQRGGQKRLADGAGCLPSYLSQVMAGTAELTPDQAYGMAGVMGFDRDGTDFFVLLAHKERAAAKSFREYLERNIAEIKKRKQQMSERLNPSRVLSGDDQARYYAAWFYSAIHALTSVPECQTVKDLEKRLRLSSDIIERAVSDLERMELVRRDGAKVIALARDIHAASTSALNYSYHFVWRSIANQRMQETQPGQNVHYTALYGISRADVQKIKSLCYEFIQNSRDIVGPSKEETVAALGIDFFEL